MAEAVQNTAEEAKAALGKASQAVVLCFYSCCFAICNKQEFYQHVQEFWTGVNERILSLKAQLWRIGNILVENPFWRDRASF